MTIDRFPERQTELNRLCSNSDKTPSQLRSITNEFHELRADLGGTDDYSIPPTRNANHSPVLVERCKIKLPTPLSTNENKTETSVKLKGKFPCNRRNLRPLVMN